MSAPDDALDPIVERAGDRETWIGVKQADDESREFDMAELERLRAMVAIIEARHVPYYPRGEVFGTAVCVEDDHGWPCWTARTIGVSS